MTGLIHVSFVCLLAGAVAEPLSAKPAAAFSPGIVLAILLVALAVRVLVRSPRLRAFTDA